MPILILSYRTAADNICRSWVIQPKPAAPGSSWRVLPDMVYRSIAAIGENFKSSIEISANDWRN